MFACFPLLHYLSLKRLLPWFPFCPILNLQVTQLGHVKDLATAFVKILGNPRAARQVYNISGER